MKIEVILLVFGCTMAAVSANPDAWLLSSGYRSPSITDYLRSGMSTSQIENQANVAEGRQLFITQTFTIATSTITSTLTSTTICTTSTSALASCSPSGRRRRGLLLNRRGLKNKEFFDEGEDNDKGFASDSMRTGRTEPVAISADVDELKPTPAVVIPVMVQPGITHNVPREARFFLALATFTTTTTSITTSISTITAVCSSISAYQQCGASGK